MGGNKEIIFSNFLYKREVVWIGEKFIPSGGGCNMNFGNLNYEIHTFDYPTILGKILGKKFKKSSFIKERELFIPPTKSWINTNTNKKVKNIRLKVFLEKLIWRMF